jgi:hypothetical protein
MVSALTLLNPRHSWISGRNRTTGGLPCLLAMPLGLVCEPCSSMGILPFLFGKPIRRGEARRDAGRTISLCFLCYVQKCCGSCIGFDTIAGVSACATTASRNQRNASVPWAECGTLHAVVGRCLHNGEQCNFSPLLWVS